MLRSWFIQGGGYIGGTGVAIRQDSLDQVWSQNENIIGEDIFIGFRIMSIDLCFIYLNYIIGVPLII